MDTLLNSEIIVDTPTNILLNQNFTGTTLINVLLLSAVALILGFILSKVHGYKNTPSKSFQTTLAILPFIIQLIILLVNGNVGTGVAVMGAFGLVRFRSMPGTSKEIGSIFASMAIGLALGTGQIYIAIVFTLIFAIVMIMYENVNLFGGSDDDKVKYQQLKITVPEDLYTPDVFTTVLEKYTLSYELVNVKTSNLGTLFKLEYKIVFDENKDVKHFLNELRCRNGNLDINFNYIIKENSKTGL